MTVKWTRRALRDMRYLFDFISDDDPAAARRMVAHLRDAAGHLGRTPQPGRPGRVSGTRELVLAATPYVVVYRIEGDQVQIVAVIHGGRRWPDTFE